MTKIAYLTIDDAPSKNFTALLDYLQKREITAIFFCEGRKIDARPDMMVDAIQRGFLVGNHSYDHPNFAEIDLAEVKCQILVTDRLIEKAYREAGIARPIKVFRFPYLSNGDGNWSKNCDWQNEHVAAIQEILRDAGYRQPKFEGVTYDWFLEAGADRCANVDCTYDTFDWCLQDGAEEFGYRDLPTILSLIDEDVPDGGRGLNDPHSNEIVMMHAWISLEAFQAIIEKIESKGIEFRMPKLQ